MHLKEESALFFASKTRHKEECGPTKGDHRVLDATFY